MSKELPIVDENKPVCSLEVALMMADSMSEQLEAMVTAVRNDEAQEVGGIISDWIGNNFIWAIKKFSPVFITRDRVKALCNEMFTKASVWATYTSNRIDDAAVRILRDGFNLHFDEVFDIFAEFMGWMKDASDPTGETYIRGTRSAEVPSNQVMYAKVADTTGISIELIQLVLPVIIYALRILFR